MTKHGVSGVECPECGSVRTKALATGRTDDGIRLRRRRCIDCQATSFLTVEVPIEASWGELDTDYKLRQRDYSRRKRKAQTLRYMDWQKRARSEQAFGCTSMSTVEVPTVRIAGGVPVVLNPSPGRRSASSRLSR